MALTKTTSRLTDGNSINIMDFVPSGTNTETTDCSSFIQAAIDELQGVGNGKIICSYGVNFRIDNTIDFSGLAGGSDADQFNVIDFNGAKITWNGSDVAADPMFYFYNNRRLEVKNFTLFCNPSATLSNSVKGIFVDSLQPEGSDALKFSSFRIRYASICIDLGSTTGGTQNRVSDCMFEHYLLEGSSVGVQTNSTNCDSLVFKNANMAGCSYGFNLVRAGFVEIENVLGYACDPYCRVAGPIGPLNLINCQSEQGGLTDPAFFYRKIYDNAKTGPVNMIGCNIDNKIWLDYDAGIGSAPQTININGGYFRDMIVSPPDAIVNLNGTHQPSGETLTVSASSTNSRIFDYGSRIEGTISDSPSAYRYISPLENTFTPTVIGSTSAGTATYTQQVGTYTRFADLVYFQIYLVWSGGTGTGNLKITGLPFTSADISVKGAGASVTGYASDIAVTAGNYITAYVESSSTNIAILQNVTGGGSASSVPYDAAGEITLSGWYKT
jgi:hypothetical protein